MKKEKRKNNVLGSIDHSSNKKKKVSTLKEGFVVKELGDIVKGEKNNFHCVESFIAEYPIKECIYYPENKIANPSHKARETILFQAKNVLRIYGQPMFMDGLDGTYSSQLDGLDEFYRFTNLTEVIYSKIASSH